MTCKFNEAVALNTLEVAKWVKLNRVVTLKADYSGQDPEIAKALTELGNIGLGIPFYAVYPSNGGDPITFDGVITQQKVLDTLAQASGQTASN